MSDLIPKKAQTNPSMDLDGFGPLSSNPYGYDGRVSENTSEVAEGFSFAVSEEARRKMSAERQKIRDWLTSDD